jgi:hypothetical protein
MPETEPKVLSQPIFHEPAFSEDKPLPDPTGFETKHPSDDATYKQIENLLKRTSSGFRIHASTTMSSSGWAKPTVRTAPKCSRRSRRPGKSSSIPAATPAPPTRACTPTSSVLRINSRSTVRGRTPPIVPPFSFIWATWSTILARHSIITINSIAVSILPHSDLRHSRQSRLVRCTGHPGRSPTAGHIPAQFLL